MSATILNNNNLSDIRWLARVCHCLSEGEWPSELPVVYDAACFDGDSQHEANHVLFDAISRNGCVENITLKNVAIKSEEGNLLAKIFRRNPLLHTLNLSKVAIAESEEDPRLWKKVFENSKNVRTLTLDRCQISPALSLAIGEMIRSGSLNCLKLNKVDIIHPEEVVKAISESGLSCLEIRSVRMEHQHLSRLFECQKANSKLKKLVVTRCGLECGSALALAELLACNNSSIATLNISENDFGAEGTEILTRQGLQQNKSLQKLILSHNPIGDVGAATLAQWLQHDQTLKSLSLIDCEIWGRGCVAFGTALKHMRGLQSLMVDSEFDDHVDVILESMKSNMSLTRLCTDRILVHDDPRWEQVEFYLKLNRAKRRILIEQDVPESLLSQVLATNSKDASVLLYLLQHKPELACGYNNNYNNNLA